MRSDVLSILVVLLTLGAAANDQSDHLDQNPTNLRKPQLQTFASAFLCGILFTLVTMSWLGVFSWTRLLSTSKVLQKAKEKSNNSTGVFSNEELKMVLVVRNDLKMGKGKIGAQCGHAVLGAYRRAEKSSNPHMKQWLAGGQRKVVLKDESEEAVLNLKMRAENNGLNNYVVCDAGRTQIEAGSLTVLAIGPAPESTLDAITGHLKLL